MEAQNLFPPLSLRDLLKESLTFKNVLKIVLVLF